MRTVSVLLVAMTMAIPTVSHADSPGTGFGECQPAPQQGPGAFSCDAGAPRGWNFLYQNVLPGVAVD